MAQFSTSTRFNRYPEIFRTLQARIAEQRGFHLDGERLRILSFGCSVGSEVMSLRCYFPDAWIFGCDINQEALSQARRNIKDPRSHIFESTPQAIPAHGPFDAILAMSVLCRWGLSRKANNLDAIYPFQKFADDVAMLGESLRPGGLLVLYNTNHLFREVSVASSFGVVGSNLVYENGFVDKWDRTGNRLTKSDALGEGFEHRIVANGAELHDGDFQDCIYEKGALRERELVMLGLEPPPEPLPDPRELRSVGPNLEAAAADRRVVSAFETATFAIGDGPMLTRMRWSKSGVDGGVVRVPPYWTIASDMSANRIAALSHNCGRDEKSSPSLFGGLADKPAETSRWIRHHLEKFVARWR